MTQLMTPREVAALLNVKVTTLENWRGLGQGPTFTKLGDGARAPVRYKREDVENYLHQRTTVSKS